MDRQWWNFVALLKELLPGTMPDIYNDIYPCLAISVWNGLMSSILYLFRHHVVYA